MKIKQKIICYLLPALLVFTAFGEEEYAFRQRLETVHENNRRDESRAPAADEFVFRDGFTIELPASATPFMRRVARDFADYLADSMDVSARVAFRGASGKRGFVHKCGSLKA
jgi:hypothetical protein